MADRYSEAQRCTIQANLYIINRIFSHTKCHKKFDGDTFYSIMGISKPRYYRILGGVPFHLNKDDCEKLGRNFGISEQFFTGNNLIDFAGIKHEHWLSYFKHRNKYPMTHTDRGNLNLINTKLQNVRYKDILIEYPITSEVYRIQYYFTYGNKLEEEEASLIIKRSVSELENIEFKELEKLGSDTLNEYRKRLEVQLERLKTLVEYKKYSNQ